MLKLKYFSLFLVAISFAIPGFACAEDIRIALRANKGAEKGLEKWQATADYLTDKIPGYRFVIVPFENNSSLNQAVSLGNFQFCLTNPASGVEHKIRYGALPLATLVNKRRGKGYSKFGSVIFTRADRKDVNSFKDLKGKMFIGADELGFGGWRVAWLELLENDINPYTDFSELRFAGGKQQNVVYEVRDKKVAAGSVRTDMLERMAASNKINLADYKILGKKETEGFPFLHSTKLYPEWMFSAVGKIDESLKTRVMKTLFSIKPDSLAAKKGKYIKWIAPLDYAPVDNLLKELKVGPYNVATLGIYESFIIQYGWIALAVIIIILGLTLAFLHVLKLNKQILSAKESLKNEISIRTTLERQLLHSQRIESLGQLTGGIAHDFNNMLASITGFTELVLLSEPVKNDKKLTGYLNQIMSSSDRCASLVNQMLIFSRSEADTDINEKIFVSNFIHDIYPLLKSSLPGNIKLHIDDIDENLYIISNIVTMTQVIMSLYLNAKDAINDERGTITIGADVLSLNTLETFCDSCHQSVQGDYVYIYVKDTGCGIDLATQQHIFDPFFTTKEVGKGTGMGLSVVHGITHKNDGHVFIESEVANGISGTTVKILLPQINKEDNQKNAHLKNDKRNSSGHIMIVDEEIALTVYLAEFLQQKGFKTTTFNNSKEALDYFEVHTEEFDLVITDQSMPNLNGTDMAKKMMSFKQNMPVILCSEHNEAIDENDKSELNIHSYISKPIQLDKLLKSINSLLK